MPLFYFLFFQFYSIYYKQELRCVTLIFVLGAVGALNWLFKLKEESLHVPPLGFEPVPKTSGPLTSQYLSVCQRKLGPIVSLQKSLQ
jgi:hypothetical protein